MTEITGIRVGANKEAILEAKYAILDILNSYCDQSTKVVALQTLSELCNTNNTTISGCNITVGKVDEQTETKT